MSGGGSPALLLSFCIRLLRVTLPILSFLTFQTLLDVSLLYNTLSFALWYLLKNLFLLIGELSPFTCIDMTFAFSSVLLHFLYYFDISHFIDSQTHVSPYFNIYEIKMCLPVDGMLKVN